MDLRVPYAVPPGGYRTVNVPLPPGLKRVYIPEEIIARRVKELAELIATDFSSYIHALVILKGAVVFAADLFREIHRIAPVEIYHSFLKASSYGTGTCSGGEVVLSHDVHEVRGKHILIVEDIVDTGVTLARLRDYLLKERGARSVGTCVLLDKPARRIPGVHAPIEYRGFEVEDLFLVGYGLDYAEKYRELPYVAVLDEEALAREKHDAAP